MKNLLVFLLAVLCALPSLATPQEEDPLQALLQEKGWVSAPTRQPPSPPRLENLVLHAMGFIGVPYQRGGNSFTTGVDCSGFVKAIFEQALGLELPRSAHEQAEWAGSIRREELAPGDLVFFNTLKRAYSHVGIYVGDGKFIHSPRTGATVRIDDMGASYWRSRYNGSRRVPLASPSQEIDQTGLKVSKQKLP